MEKAAGVGAGAGAGGTPQHPPLGGGGVAVPPLPRGCSPKMVFSNLGICALLLGYTLLGAFLFLAIEGTQSHRHPTPPPQPRRLNVTAAQVESWVQETRNRTVESIWDITVSLNILYGENWTRLATSEILKFQDFLIERLSQELIAPPQEVSEPPFQWTFARAFLYSLTTLTTIGYGRVGPRSALGKAITVVYAVLGIPLMLLYLSSVGALLARCARLFCARACLSRRRPGARERGGGPEAKGVGGSGPRPAASEPFYLRTSLHNSLPDGDVSREKLSLDDGDLLKDPCTPVTLTPSTPLDASRRMLAAASAASLAASPFTASAGSLLLPALLCALAMAVYLLLGALVLAQWEAWDFLERAYFCFMALSTIGFGDLLPGDVPLPVTTRRVLEVNRSVTVTATVVHAASGGESASTAGSGSAEWFCSFYILLGMALTAMCFNICHEELAHRAATAAAASSAAAAAAAAAMAQHQQSRMLLGSAGGRGPPPPSGTRRPDDAFS